ncbi:MAG: hypothetical protein ACYCW6_21980 [Candidatus Xenobia bacterium]
MLHWLYRIALKETSHLRFVPQRVQHILELTGVKLPLTWDS